MSQTTVFGRNHALNMLKIELVSFTTTLNIVVLLFSI